MSPRTPEQFAEIREERKARILDAALHVFADQGFHNSSVSAVAKEAGISKGLVYNYFESKEEILVMLINALFDKVEKLLPFMGQDSISEEEFRIYIERSVDVVLEDPKRWKLFMSMTLQPDVLALLMDKAMARMAPYMRLLHNYFAERGHKDPALTMRYFSAVLDGVQLHTLLDPENFPVEQAKQMIIDQFV